MTTTSREPLASTLAAERGDCRWWRTPDWQADRHRQELAAALADYRDPEYERRTWAPTRSDRDRAVIEDVEWMTATGESTEGICRRLATSRAAIAKRLERSGRSDLARPFYRSK